MRSLAALFTMLIALAVAMPAHADSTPAQPATSTAADTGERIKQGAKRAAIAVKHGAVDLWEASKAAVAAGSQKLSERHAQRQSQAQSQEKAGVPDEDKP